MSVLDASQPIFRFFEEISAVPRGSHNETGIADHLAAFARARGLRFRRDEMNNVVVYKPGSPGREHEAPVMLQSHMDMVCVQNGGGGHDFTKDPISLRVEDGWLSADGTTLGADDGAGMAWMLAALDDEGLSHPPLECVFTAAEETGMDGARGLKPDAVTARRCVNLDCGGEVGTCVSSAGGRRVYVHFPASYTECSLPVYAVSVSGLKGGHSGVCIDQELGNAIKLLFRLLYRLLERGVDVRIVNIAGGLKDNAIPAEAGVTFASAASTGMIEKLLNGVYAELQEELRETDGGIAVGLDTVGRSTSAMTPEDSGALVCLGYLLPNGMRARSLKLNTPVLSLNLGVLTQEDEELIFDYCLRSPMQSAREELTRELEAVSSIFGAHLTVESDYPGWPYEETSPLREALRAVLKERGVEMEEWAIHGGLETGIFKGRYPDMDIVTYGPISPGAHTPEEKLDLASFRRGYENLTRLLEVM